MKSSSKRARKASKVQPKDKDQLRYFVLATVASSILSVIFIKLYEYNTTRWYESNGAEGTHLFVYKNLGVTFLIFSTLGVIALKVMQRKSHWLKWFRNPNDPEMTATQMAKRQSIFLRSYSLLVVMALSWFFIYSDQSIMLYFWLWGIMMYSLPTLFEAWDKK